MKDIFHEDGTMLTFSDTVQKGIPDNMCFRWIQLVSALPSEWRKTVNRTLSKNDTQVPNTATSKYHCKVRNKVLPVQSLTCKSIYSALADRIRAVPTSLTYFKGHLNIQEDINWKDIFTLPRKTMVESKMQNFQYQILNSIFFLNNKLLKTKLAVSPLCSICKEANETPLHLYFPMSSNRTVLEEFTRVVQPMFYSSGFNT